MGIKEVRIGRGRGRGTGGVLVGTRVETYGGVVVGKGIVDAHVFEKALDVDFEESLDFFEVVLRVHEHGADIRLHDVR